jgi:hypothetical protein
MQRGLGPVQIAARLANIDLKKSGSLPSDRLEQAQQVRGASMRKVLVDNRDR